MKRSTLLTSFLSILSSGLLCLPTTAYAQHGGGHAGGGGGGHAATGGGFHGGGGSYGGFHGGGGYSGGYHGGGAGSYADRGPGGGMRGESMAARSSGASRPWSWKGTVPATPRLAGTSLLPAMLPGRDEPQA